MYGNVWGSGLRTAARPARLVRRNHAEQQKTGRHSDGRPKLSPEAAELIYAADPFQPHQSTRPEEPSDLDKA
jgi:hypothetical protein